MRAITSERRARALSSALVLFGLAFLTYHNNWWPLIMLVIGIPLAIRQFLLGRWYDSLLSLLIFGGVYFTSQYRFSWRVVMPVVFGISAIYLIGREFFSSRTKSESDREEDLNHEIEEDDK